MMTRKSRYLFLIGIIILLPIAGYIVSYAMTPVPEQGVLLGVVLVLLTILLLLVVPYWILKLATRAAHQKNSLEKEMKLKDIAKDQDELTHSTR